MIGEFDRYNVAIIDASLYFQKLSDAFITELKKVKYIYIAGTFNAETQEIMEVQPSCREICESNIRLLNHEVHPRVMNLSAYPDFNNDIWDFLTLIAERPNADKALLITGSIGLIQRVICFGLGIDIFDLQRSELLHHQFYEKESERYFVDNDESPASTIETDSIGENSKLYTGKGGSVILGEMLGDGSGSEGNVFFIRGSNPVYVGKIFKTGKFPLNKFRSVQKMVKDDNLKTISWAMFPDDILYADFWHKKPVGIIEPYGQTHSSLYDDELFFGDPGNWSSSLLSVKVSDLLCLCEYITRQVCYLHSIGVYVSDFNIKNFDYALNRFDRFIQMWDTDSFAYGNYFSGYMADNDKAKAYDITKRADICELCNDELYHFIFQILTLGDTPLNPYTGGFNYESKDYINYGRREFVPNSIWSVFEKYYMGNTKASPQMMLYLLREEIRKRAASPRLDETYKDIVDQIEPGFLASQDESIGGEMSPALNMNPMGRSIVVDFIGKKH